MQTKLTVSDNLKEMGALLSATKEMQVSVKCILTLLLYRYECEVWVVLTLSILKMYINNFRKENSELKGSF